MKRRQRWATLEILVVAACIQSFGWWVAPHVTVPHLAPLLLVALVVFTVYVAYVSPRLFGDTPAARGLGPPRALFVHRKTLAPAAKSYGLLTLVCGVAIVLSSALRTPQLLSELDWGTFFLKLAAYSVSALFQQLIFLGWLCMRLRAVFGRESAGASTRGFWICCVAAGLGGLAHYPNVQLMWLCLPFAFAVAWIHLRSPNLLAAAFCHALVGTMMHRLAGISMRIGPFYEDPDLWFFRSVFPFLKTLLKGVE